MSRRIPSVYLKPDHRWIAAIATLVAIVFWSYRYGLLDYPRRDQIEFEAERAEFVDTGSWLWHALSYNRTRRNNPGDRLLFRPGTHLVLAIEAVPRSGTRRLSGLLSVETHLIVAVLLYLLLRSFAPKGFPLTVAALFAAQFAGLEMVLWRHISPYMLSAAFALAAFFFLERPVLAGLFFFTAMLFHESAAVSLAIVAILLLFSRRRQLAMSIGVSLAAYLALDAVDWLVRSPAAVTGPADNPMRWLDAVLVFIRYFGSATQAVLCPFSVRLEWIRPKVFIWDLGSENVFSLVCWFVLGTAVCVATLRRALPRARREGDAADVLVLWAVCGALSVAAMVSAGRGALRSLDYLSLATYYYWFFALFFAILIGYWLDAAARAHVSGRAIRLAVAAGWLIVFAEAGMIRAQTSAHYWQGSLQASR